MIDKLRGREGPIIRLALQNTLLTVRFGGFQIRIFNGMFPYKL